MKFFDFWAFGPNFFLPAQILGLQKLRPKFGPKKAPKKKTLLSNNVLDAFVTHLEQKLFEFEILQFLNLAYFLHIKANFKPKYLDTIKNHAFSNEH